LVEARTIEATDDIFSQFVDGLSSGGATVEASATESGERDDVAYRCVPVVAPQIEAAACMWRDEDTVGIVFRLDAGIAETKDLLIQDLRRARLSGSSTLGGRHVGIGRLPARWRCSQ
jgi:hypothetical protein